MAIEVKKKGGFREGAGRPQKDIKEEDVIRLASHNGTADEIASTLGCTKELIYRRFSNALKDGRDKGSQSIKSKLYELAMQGNLGALIWLSKQPQVGYKDKTELEAGEVTFNLVINPIPK